MTYIEGDFTSDSFANIQIAIKPCRNLTEAQEKEYKLEGKKFPTVCKDQKIIDKQLSNAVFAAYFTDKVVDPTNLDHPFTNVPRDMFWPVTN